MDRKGKAAASGSARGSRKSQAGALSNSNSERLNLQDLPDDILLKILGLVAAKRSAEVLAAMWTSQRLRGLARHPTLWVEPLFHREDSPQLFLAICETFGASFRRVCLSALPRISADEAERGLELGSRRAKRITHLSLADFAGPQDAASRSAKQVEFKDEDEDSIFQGLPVFSRMEHLNLTDVCVCLSSLRDILKASAKTLERLYCCKTSLALPAHVFEQERKRRLLHKKANSNEAPDDQNQEPAASIVRALAGLTFPKLAQLDLSGTLCTEAGVEALVCSSSLPALEELFLVAPRKNSAEYEDRSEPWDPTELAGRLAVKKPGLRVVHEDFMDVMYRAIGYGERFATSIDGQFGQQQSRAELWEKAAALLPIVQRCAGVDAPTWAGGTLLHYALATGHFAAAVRIVEEFGASPLALALPGSYRAQRDPWSAPYPVHDRYSLMGIMEACPHDSVLHLSCSSDTGTGGLTHPARIADRALIDELPEIFRRWGLAKLVNLRNGVIFDVYGGRKGGNAPLHLSISMRKRRWHTLILPLKPEVLLELGADPAVQDECGQTTAHKLEMSPDPVPLKLFLERSPGLVNMSCLCTCGSLSRDSDARCKSDKTGKTPLILFVDQVRSGSCDGGSDWLLRLKECIRLLLETPGSNAGLADKQGRTALHAACLPWYGCRDVLAARAGVISSLLERLDVDPNAADNEGRTPLFLAAICGHAELVRALLNGAAGRVDLEAIANDGRTPLFAACEKQDAPIVRLLLEAGADPNRAPTGRAGPLRTFLRKLKGQPPHNAAEMAAVRTLFRKKGGKMSVFGPPAPADELGRTALHRAAAVARGRRGAQTQQTQTRDVRECSDDEDDEDTPRARTLSECLLDESKPARALAACTPAGETPLLIACKSGNREAAEACLAQSPVLVADADGRTALHYILRKPDLEHLAADILARCHDAARAGDVDRRTPLHVLASAAGSGPEWGELHARAASALVPLSDLLAQDSRGRTPLHVAARSCCPIQVLKLMLGHPRAAAALAVQDNMGATPLHLACKWLCPEEHVRAMLVEGAPAATARDSEGRLAAEVAPPALRRVIEAFLEETKPGPRGRKRARTASG